MLCFIFSLLSCSKEKNSNIVYDYGQLTGTDASKIDLDTIMTDIEFVNPEQILSVNDSILVIFESEAEKLCKAISISGQFIGEFGVRGKSDVELISPICMTVEDNDIVGIFDYNSMKLKRYSIKKLVSNNNSFLSNVDFREILSSNKKDNTVINNIVAYGANKYVLFGNNNNRVMIYDNGKIINTYTDYPLTDKDKECNWAIWGYSARYGISPNKQHLVITTYVGTLFETFEISSNKISQLTLKGFFEPKYNICKGAKPTWISPDYNHPEGFYSLYADDEKIYATIGGKDCERRNELLIFDYSGELKGKYLLPCDIKCMTRQTNNIFFLLESKDGSILLCKKDVKAFI